MPAVVLGLLAGHMIFIFTAITLGTGDPSFAVVPDYYAKAVDHDDRKSLLARSAELGWSVQLAPSDTADIIGQRQLIVLVHDAEGEPIAGLSMHVEAYHLARAGYLVEMDCVEAQPGQYVGQARMTKEGFWQFAIDATNGEQRFIADYKQFVIAPEAMR